MINFDDKNNKNRIKKLIQTLDLQLNKAGLQDKIQLSTSEDMLEIIEIFCVDLINLASQRNPNNFSDSQLNKDNEIVVLQCMKLFIDANVELSNFSKLLYDGDFPRDLYRSYRQLYEAVNAASSCLYQFESDNEDFLKVKEDLITESLEQRSQIQKSSNLKKQGKNQKLNMDMRGNQLIESLKKQIQDLNQLNRQNDQEFVVEIQKYNNTLFDMQETIREYEVRLDKVREYEASIDDLEHKLIRLKQEKYRDDMLIDNMSKKIRFYEKERGGPDTFISPRASQSRKNAMMSPTNRILGRQNQSMYGPNGSNDGIKYYGQKIILG